MFWDKFTEIYGEESRNHIPYFDEYYLTDFDKVQASCGFNSQPKDMIAETVGMKVFLITDCLINKEHKDISIYNKDGFDDLR